jgi:hypothetical protein
MIIIKEAYSKPNVNFVNQIMQEIKETFFTTEIVIDIIELLNKKFARYNVYFEMNEEPGQDWLYGDQDIQLSFVSDRGTIHIYVGDMFIEKNNTDISYQQLIKTLENILVHELIHRQQISKIPFSVLKNIDTSSNEKYLSDPKEIDAHAMQAVSEFSQFYDKNKIKQIISNYNSSKDSAVDSVAFWKYWSFFGLYSDTNDDPESNNIWKKFLKRMYYFLIEAK